MIELANEHISVVIADEMGAEVRYLGRPDGENLLAWYEWRTPVPANQSRTYGSSLLDWCSEYRGGWQELFPNAGSECEVNDVPVPFHGEASRTAWKVHDQSANSVRLTAGVRLPLVVDRQMSLVANAPTLLVEETVLNESDTTVPFVWVHHPAFVAAPGTTIDLPATMIHTDDSYTTPIGDLTPGAQGTWPLVPTKDGGHADLSVIPDGRTDRLCYATSLNETWAAIRHGSAGLALAWNPETHPFAWLWTEIAVPTMPSYGRSRIIAVEPASYWPADGLARATEDGRAHTIGPGERLTSWLTISLFDATDIPVSHVDRAGTVHTSKPE
jgi:galactose mutarotase-like enzyme